MLLCLPVKNGFCQAYFQNTIGGTGDDYCYAVRQTYDGGYIVAGVTNSYGAGNGDVYVIKTDAVGKTVWSKTFGGASYTEEGWSIQQTDDNNDGIKDDGYIIAGFEWSFFITGTNVNDDVYLIKLDVNGTMQWSKDYGDLTTYDEFAVSVQQTADKGYIIAGYTDDYGSGNDAYLLKTDKNGVLSWTKTFSFNSGGWGDIATSVQQTSDLGYIVLGTTNAFGSGSGDIFLIKTDGSGVLEWSKTYGGAGDDEASAIQQTVDGGYAISGYTKSFGAGGWDMYLIKTNAAGVVSWSKAYGGSKDEQSSVADQYWGLNGGGSLQQTADSGYIVTGYTNSFGNAGSNDVYLIKTDSMGNHKWSKTYGGTKDDYGASVQQTADGGYIVGGQTNSLGAGGNDIYLIKTNSIGYSGGCYEQNSATVTHITTTITTTVTPGLGSGGNTRSPDPATVVGSGSSEKLICPCASPPSVSINPSDVTICQGSSQALAASGGSYYTWSPSVVYNSTDGASVTASPTTTTIYKATEFICGISANATVTVIPEVTIKISPDVSVCKGANANLTASGGVNYLWSPSSNLSPTVGASVVANPSITTVYSVREANGCSNTATARINIYQVPVTISGPLVTCSGSPVDLSATVSAGYLWSTGATVKSIEVSSAGNYSVTVTNAYGCSNSSSITVAAGSTPTISISGSLLVCNGIPTTLSASGGAFYLWSTGATTQTITVSAVGFVSVTVTDVSTCTNSTSIMITADNCTGIEERNLDESLSIYPNPNAGQFTIEINDQLRSGNEIKVYDILGKLIFDEKVNDQKNYIDLSDQPKGVYFVKIYNSDFQVSNKKIAIQ